MSVKQAIENAWSQKFLLQMWIRAFPMFGIVQIWSFGSTSYREKKPAAKVRVLIQMPLKFQDLDLGQLLEPKIILVWVNY